MDRKADVAESLADSRRPARRKRWTELELRTRRVAFDPLAQSATLEMRVCQYIAGNEVARETYAIDMCIYFKNEIELMLATAGFHCVAVTAALEDRAPQPWKDERVIFTAHA